MWERQYYTLHASLPALPYFDKAKVLPISRERLEARMGMLAPEDAETMEKVWTYFAYERQPIERTDPEMVAFYNTIMSETTQPTLRGVIEFGMSQRTVVAALRRRHRGLPAPRPGELWGGGPWAGHIARNWGDADLNLAPVLPWVPGCRKLLEAGESLALEKRLKELAWNHLGRLVDGHYFSFDAVLIYLMRWNLLNQWLLHDEKAATARFEALTAEMMSGREHLFA